MVHKVWGMFFFTCLQCLEDGLLLRLIWRLHVLKKIRTMAVMTFNQDSLDEVVLSAM